jgi:hypothetical protein
MRRRKWLPLARRTCRWDTAHSRTVIAQRTPSRCPLDTACRRFHLCSRKCRQSAPAHRGCKRWCPPSLRRSQWGMASRIGCPRCLKISLGGKKRRRHPPEACQVPRVRQCPALGSCVCALAVNEISDESFAPVLLGAAQQRAPGLTHQDAAAKLPPVEVLENARQHVVRHVARWRRRRCRSGDILAQRAAGSRRRRSRAPCPLGPRHHFCQLWGRAARARARRSRPRAREQRRRGRGGRGGGGCVILRAHRLAVASSAADLAPAQGAPNAKHVVPSS